jgi:hypothetical protein
MYYWGDYFEYDNEKYSVKVLNPLDKVKELVLGINAIFLCMGLNKFILNKNSNTEIIYSHT